MPNRTIYIRENVWKKFRLIKNKSAYVNALLEKSLKRR